MNKNSDTIKRPESTNSGGKLLNYRKAMLKKYPDQSTPMSRFLKSEMYIAIFTIGLGLFAYQGQVAKVGPAAAVVIAAITAFTWFAVVSILNAAVRLLTKALRRLKRPKIKE